MTTNTTPRQAGAWVMSAIGKKQRLHLEQRLRDACPREWDWPRRQDTPEVAAMRSRISLFDEATDLQVKAACQKMREARKKVEAAVLFSPSAETALAMVEEFERLAQREGWTSTKE